MALNSAESVGRKRKRPDVGRSGVGLTPSDQRFVPERSPSAIARLRRALEASQIDVGRLRSELHAEMVRHDDLEVRFEQLSAQCSVQTTAVAVVANEFHADQPADPVGRRWGCHRGGAHSSS